MQTNISKITKSIIVTILVAYLEIFTSVTSTFVFSLR